MGYTLEKNGKETCQQWRQQRAGERDQRAGIVGLIHNQVDDIGDDRKGGVGNEKPGEIIGPGSQSYSGIEIGICIGFFRIILIYIMTIRSQMVPERYVLLKFVGQSR